MSNTAVIDIPISMMDRLGTATFEELAEFAEASINSASTHARQAVHHLIEAGGALCEMRDRMIGQYGEWLQSAGITPHWARICQRLFVYRNELPPEVFMEWSSSDGRRHQPSLTNAIKSISHLPSLRLSGHPGYHRIDDDARAAVKRMLSEGVPVREVANLTGVSLSCVKDIRNPNQAKERMRRNAKARTARREAERALQEQKLRAERDALAKVTGKEASVAYGAVRQALAALAKVSSSAAHVDAATGYLTAAESRIVAIMQEERASGQ